MSRKRRLKSGPISIGQRTLAELITTNWGDLAYVEELIDDKEFPVEERYRRGPVCLDWSCFGEEMTADEAAARLAHPDTILASLAAVLAWGAESGFPHCPVVPLAQASFAGRRARQVPRIDRAADFFILELVTVTEKLAWNTRFPIIHRS